LTGQARLALLPSGYRLDRSDADHEALIGREVRTGGVEQQCRISPQYRILPAGS
jgi:hypothetical protein